MDISEESRSSAVEQTLRHHGAGSLEDDEAGCNWDVEALQFVVDSFLHLFLEEKSNCQRQQRRVRKESRGRIKTQESEETSQSSRMSRLSCF